jgi:hypothetical protein
MICVEDRDDAVGYRGTLQVCDACIAERERRKLAGIEAA